MASLDNIVSTYKDRVLKIIFSSDDKKLQSELTNKKVGSSDGSTMADLQRAIHNYLEHHVEEKLEHKKQEIVSRLKNENLSDEELNLRVVKEWYDAAIDLRIDEFSTMKADLTMEVIEEENYNVLYTKTVIIDVYSFDAWKAYKPSEFEVKGSFWVNRDVLQEFRQVVGMISNHNRDVKLTSICDAESPREKQLVVEFCEGQSSDGIPDGAVFNRRLLERIEDLHRRMLACPSYAKLYVGIKYVDSDDILQLERFSLGSIGEFEELYSMLNHFSRKFKNTQPFDR